MNARKCYKCGRENHADNCLVCGTPLAPVTGYADAIERAATALEHRIYMTETVMLPQVIEHRNGGVAAALREALTNDQALPLARKEQP